MQASIVKIEQKRNRGRPKTMATPVMVRVLPDQLEALDEWIGRQPKKLGRPEAIRQLINESLAAATKRAAR